MSATPSSFVLEPGQQELCLLRLRQRFDPSVEPIDETIRYFDTFDWRLYACATTLVVTTAGRGGRSAPVTVTWQSLAGVPRRRLQLTAAPAFAGDLPTGPAREDLEAVIGVRRLLPLVTVRRRGSLLHLRNDDGKIVLRVRCLDRRIAGGGSLGAQLLVEPLKGYGKQARAVETRLRTELGADSRPPDELDEALAVIGRAARDYSSKISIALQPRMSAESAMRAVHAKLLAVIRANEAGVLDDVDSEFLHDFRVAVRRTRSVLGQIKGVYPGAATKRFAGGFSWLGSVTGPLRDLDVFLLRTHRYSEELAPADRADLRPLERLLLQRRGSELRRVVRVLSGRRYAALLRAWEEFLQTPISPHRSRPRSNLPILEVVSRRTWKVYRRVLAAGRVVTRDSPDSDLHRLRIEAKKLRYLMELFRSLYPQEIEVQIKELKGLQDLLGDINDCSVQEAALYELASELGDGTDSRTHLVIARLAERFRTDREELRAGFFEPFARFSAGRNRAACSELFRRHRGDRA